MIGKCQQRALFGKLTAQSRISLPLVRYPSASLINAA